MNKYDMNKYDIETEIITHFNDDCHIIHDNLDIRKDTNDIGFKLKIIGNNLIYLHLNVEAFEYSDGGIIHVDAILSEDDTVLSYLGYNVNKEDKYLKQLEEYIQKIKDSHSIYREFIQNISDHFENENFEISTMVDLNQYYLYIKSINKTVVIRPAFEIESGKIYTVAYIGNDNSYYHSKVYVNSANMDDTYDLVNFFL